MAPYTRAADGPRRHAHRDGIAARLVLARLLRHARARRRTRRHSTRSGTASSIASRANPKAGCCAIIIRPTCIALPDERAASARRRHHRLPGRAASGSHAYDLVSLLQDARLDVPALAGGRIAGTLHRARESGRAGLRRRRLPLRLRGARLPAQYQDPRHLRAAGHARRKTAVIWPTFRASGDISPGASRMPNWRHLARGMNASFPAEGRARPLAI